MGLPSPTRLRVRIRPLSDALWAMVQRVEPDHAASLNYYDPAQQGAAAALMALTAELRGVPSRVSEPMLGAIRLQWWRDAVGEVFGDGRVRAHPLVEALQAHIRCSPSLRPYIDGMIDATADFLGPFDNSAGLGPLDIAGIHDGALADMLGRLVGQDDLRLRRLGALYGAARCGRNAPGDNLSPHGIESPANRISQLCAAAPELDIHAEAKALWAQMTPFPQPLAPVMAALKTTFIYAQFQIPSELGRRLGAFVTVLRGR